MCDQQCCSMLWCTIYMLTGMAQMGLGIWLAIDDRVYDIRVIENPDVMDNQLIVQGVYIGLICLGTFVFISGIVGMSGVGCKSRGTLIAFTVMGSLGIVGTLVCGSISAARYAQAVNDEEFGPNIQNNLLHLYTDSNATDDFTGAWNSIQYTFECCGYENYHDYDQGAFVNSTGLVAPWTCCVRDEDEVLKEDIDHILNLEQCRVEAATIPEPATYTWFNPEGCEEWIETFYFNQLVSILAISWTAFGVQLMALILSGCLRSDLKDGWMV